MVTSLVGIGAIAFDLDDTLTDWHTGIARAAAAVGDPAILDRVVAGTWVRRDGVVVNRHHWRVLHEPAAFMPERLVEPFLATLDPPLFPDAAPALERLHGRVALALLTNNPFGAAVVERHGLHVDVFDCVVVADPDYRKPDPRAFAPLIDSLARPPADIAYVGDSIDADVIGARDAGFRAVWLDRWNDPWPVPPDVTRIGALTDLLVAC
jgi:HAD superfamily hydrolase (TIGR01549 family)